MKLGDHALSLESYVNHAESFVITHLCDKIFLHPLGTVNDQSNTTHFSHSEIQIFNGDIPDILLVLA
jgi:hypothetical protein